MIGRAETTSEPTIMVCCMDESIRSRVKNELRANATLRACREFLVHGLPHPLEQLRPAQPLARTNDSWDYNEEECYSTSPLDDVFSPTVSLSLGRRLSRPQSDSATAFWATGGIFLQIDGACFQFTAEHGPNDIHKNQDPLPGPATDHDNYSINGSDDDDEVEESPATFDLLSQGSITPKRSSFSQRSFSINQSESSFCDNESSNAEDWIGQEDTEPVLRTSENHKSQTRSEFDDMLDLKASKKVGVITIRASEGSSPELDYALVLTPPPGVSDPVNNFKVSVGIPEKSLKVLQYDSASRGKKSIVIAGGPGSVRTGVRQPGTTLFKRADLSSFQNLEAVQLNDSEFSFGDSGAAVLDQESGVFYGHIISGCPGTGIGYLVPAAEVFQDLASMGYHAVVAQNDNRTFASEVARSENWPNGHFFAPKMSSRDASTQTEDILLPTPPLSQTGSDVDYPHTCISQYHHKVELELDDSTSRWPTLSSPKRAILIAWFNDRFLDDVRNKPAEDVWAMFYNYCGNLASHKIKKVGDICRSVTLESLKSSASKESTIWLDEREHRSLQTRSSLGILTASELFERRMLKRFGESGYVDADRRVVFVQNPDSWSILSLAITCSKAEQEGVAEAIYRHVAFRPHFGVAIRMPVFVLGSRKGPGNSHSSGGGGGRDEIRQATDLSFLFPSQLRSHGASIPQFLYERHLSLLVTGFDEFRWTAYCLADSFSEDEENLRNIANYTNRELLTDPVSCGKLPIGALWDPREYFLTILRIRLRQFESEWARTTNFLERAVENQLQDGIRTTRDPAEQHSELEAQARLGRTEALIIQLWHTVSGTLEAWERFQEGHLEYVARHWECEETRALLARDEKSVSTQVLSGATICNTADHQTRHGAVNSNSHEHFCVIHATFPKRLYLEHQYHTSSPLMAGAFALDNGHRRADDALRARRHDWDTRYCKKHECGSLHLAAKQLQSNPGQDMEIGNADPSHFDLRGGVFTIAAGFFEAQESQSYNARVFSSIQHMTSIKGSCFILIQEITFNSCL
ncbi:hypothetical protein CFIO01_00258 [Colletotrichum fioriniae PJ7]|uniref:Uncharacterized protein n=1 Tax=Colletotrichum fioriniae PJ7 TaxID=1445577 RepID=A0A010S144_9PEZI|nr:hypothetical protein CFIO01_00258 [Colletotrichum fioriniae PJ7]